MTLIETAVAGIPVSTTHTITGAIMGVGSLYRFCAVRWGVAKRIIWAWILTIPASGGVAALAWYLSRAPVLGRENVLIGQRQGLAWVRDPLDRGLDARDYGLGERSVKIGPQLLSIADPRVPDIDTRAAARLHYGWVIVATFCVTETVTWGIIFYGFPVFLRAMEQDLRASSIVVTGAFSVGLGVSALAAVPVGRWLDRHGAHGLSGKLSADAARAPRLRSTRYGTGAR